jgi:uncharacterized DUF497 family protein
MEFDGFDWDEGNIEKCAMHGVSLEEVENLFTQIVLVKPDPKHSDVEQRFHAVGVTRSGRGLFVVFTCVSTDGGGFWVR